MISDINSTSRIAMLTIYTASLLFTTVAYVFLCGHANVFSLALYSDDELIAYRTRAQRLAHSFTAGTWLWTFVLHLVLHPLTSIFDLYTTQLWIRHVHPLIACMSSFFLFLLLTIAYFIVVHCSQLQFVNCFYSFNEWMNECMCMYQ